MLKERILYQLEQQKGELVTGGELARWMGVSRTAVWKAIQALQGEGNLIVSIPNRGYRMEPDSDGLSELRIRDHLRTESLGRELEALKTVDSTNPYLRRLDTAALPEGYAVVADEQTAGRGRMGRSFFAPRGQGVYLSVLLRPSLPLEEVQFLTICGAVAVCRALEAVCGFRPGIKWVNDVYHGGKKLCGILTEAAISAEMRAVDFAVMGIGINTGQVAPEVASIATSVGEITGVRGFRNRLAAEVLNQLEALYLGCGDPGERERILAAYTGRMILLGQTVTASGDGERREGTVVGVDSSGGLMLRLEDGTARTIYSGEVTPVHPEKEAESL